MGDLEKIRQDINLCDDRMIEALRDRMKYIQDIAAYKKKYGMPIFQPEQDEEQKALWRMNLSDYEFENEILDIFSSIVKNSKKILTQSLFTHNIMLIGFMGAGKSTVAAYLNDMLAMEVVEMDALIVEKEGMSIKELFERQGEEYFRDCESNTLLELQKRNQLIVSCGGGIVLREQNIENMKKNGRIVLLTASPETVLERIKDNNERPVLNGNMNAAFIESLMEKRREKYMQAADIVINTDHKSVQEICEELVGKLTVMG